MPGSARMVVLGISPSDVSPREHLEKHVRECREGDFTGFACLLTNIVDDESVWDELGVTAEERAAWIDGAIELGQQYCEEVLGGNLENSMALQRMLGFEQIADQLPITESMFDDALRTGAIEKIRKILDDARIGIFDDFMNAAKVVLSGAITHEDAGVTKEEFDQLGSNYNDYVAKQVLDECSRGDFTRLGTLEEMLDCGAISEKALREIGTIDLEKLRQARHHAQGKEIVRAAYDKSDTYGVLRLMDAIEEGTYTFHDLGITRKQYRKLINPHPIRRFIAKRIGSIGNALYAIASKIDS